MARLLAVGLVAFEIVNGGSHGVPGLLVRAHGMDAVPNHLQRLEGHHGFVVFDIVANQHQDFFAAMRTLLFG